MRRSGESAVTAGSVERRRRRMRLLLGGRPRRLRALVATLALAACGAAGAGTPAATAESSGAPSVNDPRGPAKIEVGRPSAGGSFEAGRRIRFAIPSALDPIGNVFKYVWTWSDYVGFNRKDPASATPTLRGPQVGGQTATHVFECAGIYSPRAEVVDSHGNRRRVSVARAVVVAFPSAMRKRHGSLLVSPFLRASGETASLNLAVQKVKKRRRAGRVPVGEAAKRPRTRIESISYELDGERIAQSRNPRARFKRRVSAGPHALRISVKFSRPGGSKDMSTCFQIH